MQPPEGLARARSFRTLFRPQVLVSLSVFVLLVVLLIPAFSRDWGLLLVSPDSASYLLSPGQRPPGVALLFNALAPSTDWYAALAAHPTNSLAEVMDGSMAEPLLTAVRTQKVLLIIAFAFLGVQIGQVIGRVWGSLAVVIFVYQFTVPWYSWANDLRAIVGPWPIAVIAVACAGGLAVMAAQRTAVTGPLMAVGWGLRLGLLMCGLLFVLPALGAAQLVAGDLYGSGASAVLSEPLALVFFVVFFGCLAWFLRTRSWAPAILGLVAAGCAFWTREQAIFLIALAVVPIAVCISRAFPAAWRTAKRRALAALAAVALAATVYVAGSAASPYVSAWAQGQPVESILAGGQRSWGPWAFASKLMEPADLDVASDDLGRTFLQNVLRRRAELRNTEPQPEYWSGDLGPHLYLVSFPAAQEALVAHGRPDATNNDISQLFDAYAIPIIRNHFREYVQAVVEAVGCALGLVARCSSSRFSTGVADWLLFLSICAIPLLLRRRRAAWLVGALLAAYIAYIGTAAAFDVPIARYIWFGESFLALAALVAVAAMFDEITRYVARRSTKLTQLTQRLRGHTSNPRPGSDPSDRVGVR